MKGLRVLFEILAWVALIGAFLIIAILLVIWGVIGVSWLVGGGA